METMMMCVIQMRNNHTYAPTQVNHTRVIQGVQWEIRMMGAPVGVAGSPMGPGFQVQLGGFKPQTPGPKQPCGQGQPVGVGGIGPQMMGAVEWHAQVQQIVLDGNGRQA